MEINYQAQFLLAYTSFLAGLLLGLLYDILKIVRFPFGKIGVFFSDILQTVVCFFTVQVLLFNYWNGKIRLYPYVVCFSALILYRITLGKLTSYLFTKIRSFLSPRFNYCVSAITGYIIKKRQLRKAAHGFGIKLPRRKYFGKENTSEYGN